MEFSVNEAIKNLLEKMKKENRFFEREMEFQYNLCCELKKSESDSMRVYMEYDEGNFHLNLNKSSEDIANKKFCRVDIVVEYNKEYYIIELKYGYDRSGTYGTDLKTAQDAFYTDITTVKGLVESLKNIKRGYCVFLISSDEKESIMEPKNFNEAVRENKYTHLIENYKKYITVGKYSYCIEEIKKPNAASC